ncbi:hypothetical protein [Vogesella sp. LIG4]|uniref:hypothetical protein n=1 Tax=Vogesella sp. LIG4 TaxID=1192162 RepID=UPI0012FE57D4|nr:hypothetical protein [Vogesella sp. LIG4]
MKKIHFILILLPACAFAESSPWKTAASCGDKKIIYSVNCKTATSKEESANCDSKSQTLQYAKTTITIPHFSKKELAQYSKAGTDDGLFVKNWACVKYDNKYYLRVHFESYGGHSEFDEKDDYFTEEGPLERTTINWKIFSRLERTYFKDQDDGVFQFNLGDVFGRFKGK